MIPISRWQSRQSSDRNGTTLENGAIFKKGRRNTMANYLCSVRTNYFHVKDEDEFRELMSRVYGSEDNIDLWQKTYNGRRMLQYVGTDVCT